MSLFDHLQSAIQPAADAITPSIVGIGARRRGSGVVIADGAVLTNAHNVRGDEVTVTFADGRSERGRVAGVDIDGDLAVVAIDTAGATAATWGDPEPLRVGSVVLAASAVTGGGARVTFGTVSAVSRAFRGPGGRRISGSVEHTAPLAPGSSGGPLLDSEGRVVGINTNRLGEGFYLARPADAALRGRVDALARGESPQRRRLGVEVAPAHVARRLRRAVGLPEHDGLLVRGVESGSPASAAGILEGDLIVSIASRAVADPDDLVDAIAAAGESFEVGVVRGAEGLTLSARLPAA